MLLHSLVELTLDRVPVGIGRNDEPLSGRVQLSDVEAQPLDRFPQCLDMPGLQVIALLFANLQRLSAFARAASSGTASPAKGR